MFNDRATPSSQVLQRRLCHNGLTQDEAALSPSPHVRASETSSSTPTQPLTRTNKLNRQIALQETSIASSPSASNKTPRVSGAHVGHPENVFGSEEYHTPENQRPVTTERVAKKNFIKSLCDGQSKRQGGRSSLGSSGYPTPRRALWPATTKVELENRFHSRGEAPKRRRRRTDAASCVRRRSQRLAEKRERQERQEREQQLITSSRTHRPIQFSAFQLRSATCTRSKRA